MNTTQKVLLGAIGGYVLGVLILTAAWLDDSRSMKDRFAKGELACEYHRSELICWNPKEEEK